NDHRRKGCVDGCRLDEKQLTGAGEADRAGKGTGSERRRGACPRLDAPQASRTVDGSQPGAVRCKGGAGQTGELGVDLRAVRLGDGEAGRRVANAIGDGERASLGTVEESGGGPSR